MTKQTRRKTLSKNEYRTYLVRDILIESEHEKNYTILMNNTAEGAENIICHFHYLQYVSINVWTILTMTRCHG